MIVSDYDEGVISDSAIQSINWMAQDSKFPIFVDSRSRIKLFKNVLILIPNEEELFNATNEYDLNKAANMLLHATNTRFLLVKCGKNGMSLFTKDSVKHIDAFGSDQIADVTGAGDTVLATFALSFLAATYLKKNMDNIDMDYNSVINSMILSNIAGGIKVTKSGTVPVTIEELRIAACSQEKL
jgi:D-beta-D-heptose 7-phosphate kinase/D-beta-D-heptose 1-phosphate adenosyltransferase